MAPKFLMRVIREPQSGKSLEVVNAALAFRQKSGVQGAITMSVFSPVTRVITSAPFENMADIEGMVDGVLSDPVRHAGFDAVAALCNRVWIDLSRVIVPRERVDNVKWVRRYVFHHRPTGRRQLIAALLEFNEHIDGPKASITASVNGPTVIASLGAESLSEIEAAGDRLENDPGTQTRAAAVLSAVESWGGGISRVMS